MNEPMLSSPEPLSALGRYILDDDWTASEKADGHRRLIVLRDGVVAPFTREGKPTTLPLPMTRALAAQQIDLTLDGELVGTGTNRKLWLFDMPEAANLVTPATPHAARREALDLVHQHLALGAVDIALLPWARTSEEKEALARKVLIGRGEGLIFSHRNAPYLPGKRSRMSVKVKFVKHIDCLVVGIGVDGHDNLALAVHAPHGLVDVGEVTAQAGDGAAIKRLWLDGRRDLICQVQCLYVTPDRRLYQPTRPLLRADKHDPDTVADLDLLRSSKSAVLASGGAS